MGHCSNHEQVLQRVKRQGVPRVGPRGLSRRPEVPAHALCRERLAKLRAESSELQSHARLVVIQFKSALRKFKRPYYSRTQKMKLVSTARLHAIFILWIRKFGGGRASDPRAESKPICLIIARLCAVRRVGGDTEVALAQAPSHPRVQGQAGAGRCSHSPSLTLPYPQG